MRRLMPAATLAVILTMLVAQTASAGHAVLASGSGHLMGTWHVDFDTATFNTTVLGSEDLKLDVPSLAKRGLYTDGTALIQKMGMSRPGYLTCKNSSLHSGGYVLSKIAVGTWFCFKTQLGHLARFRVDAKQPYPGGVDLTLKTWV